MRVILPSGTYDHVMNCNRFMLLASEGRCYITRDLIPSMGASTKPTETSILTEALRFFLQMEDLNKVFAADRYVYFRMDDAKHLLNAWLESQPDASKGLKEAVVLLTHCLDLCVCPNDALHMLDTGLYRMPTLITMTVKGVQVQIWKARECAGCLDKASRRAAKKELATLFEPFCVEVL